MKLSQALILAGVMIRAFIGGVVIEIRLQKGLDEALEVYMQELWY